MVREAVSIRSLQIVSNFFKNEDELFYTFPDCHYPMEEKELFRILESRENYVVIENKCEV